MKALDVMLFILLLVFAIRLTSHIPFFRNKSKAYNVSAEILISFDTSIAFCGVCTLGKQYTAPVAGWHANLGILFDPSLTIDAHCFNP
jgi:hypothetical protein